MVALNITDLINKDAGPILSATLDNYRFQSSEVMKAFVLKNKDTLSRSRHKKCLGVWGLFNAPLFELKKIACFVDSLNSQSKATFSESLLGLRTLISAAFILKEFD